MLSAGLCVVSVTAQEKTGAPVSGTTGLPDESTLVFPDAGPETPRAPAASVSFTFWDFARMILILGCVIGSIYGFFYLLRKMSGQKVQSSTMIRVLGSQVLSGNRSVHLVRVGTGVYLLGASDSSVNLISPITDRETLDELELTGTGEEEPQKKNFAELVQTMFSRGGTKSPAGLSGPDLSITDSADYIKRQQERLKKFRDS